MPTRLRLSSGALLIIVLVRSYLSWSPGLPPDKSDPAAKKSATIDISTNMFRIFHLDTIWSYSTEMFKLVKVSPIVADLTLVGSESDQLRSRVICQNWSLYTVLLLFAHFPTEVMLLFVAWRTQLMLMYVNLCWLWILMTTWLCIQCFVCCCSVIVKNCRCFCACDTLLTLSYYLISRPTCSTVSSSGYKVCSSFLATIYRIVSSSFNC